MKIKILLTILTAGMFVSQATQALPPKPEKCPGVAAIVSAGVGPAMKYQDAWMVTQRSNYDTSEQWMFLMAYLDDITEEEASSRAPGALQTLDFMGGPEQDPEGWVCYYSTDYNVLAAAITPPMDFPDNISRFRHHS